MYPLIDTGRLGWEHEGILKLVNPDNDERSGGVMDKFEIEERMKWIDNRCESIDYEVGCLQLQKKFCLRFG